MSGDNAKFSMQILMMVALFMIGYYTSDNSSWVWIIGAGGSLIFFFIHWFMLEWEERKEKKKK